MMIMLFMHAQKFVKRFEIVSIYRVDNKKTKSKNPNLFILASKIKISNKNNNYIIYLIINNFF